MCVNRPISSAVRFYLSNPATYYLRASIFLFYRLYFIEVEPIEVWVRLIPASMTFESFNPALIYYLFNIYYVGIPIPFIHIMFIYITYTYLYSLFIKIIRSKLK